MGRFIAIFLLGLLFGLVPWIRSVDFARSAVLGDSSVRLRLYLAMGGDPNASHREGTLLMDATGPRGGPGVLAVLLGHSANPNSGSGRTTPLMNAANWCWVEGVKLLVAAGADVGARDARGATAWDNTCTAPAGAREGIRKLLAGEHGI